MFLFVLFVRGCTAGERVEGGHVVMPDGSLAHIGPLVAMLRDSDATSWRRRNAVKVEAAWALHRLAGVSEADQVAIVRANAIEPLVALVRGGSSGAQEAAAAALCNLVAGGDADVLMAVVCAGAVEPLLALLGGVGNTRTKAHVLKFMIELSLYLWSGAEALVRVSLGGGKLGLGLVRVGPETRGNVARVPEIRRSGTPTESVSVVEPTQTGRIG